MQKCSDSGLLAEKVYYFQENQLKLSAFEKKGCIDFDKDLFLCGLDGIKGDIYGDS